VKQITGVVTDKGHFYRLVFSIAVTPAVTTDYPEICDNRKGIKMMKACLTSFMLAIFHVSSVVAQTVSVPSGTTELFPANNSANVNPDTRLKITFPSTPPLGNTGKISVFDASNDSLVDELDLSIPPGPKSNRTPPPYDTLTYSSIPDTIYTVNAPDTDTTHVYQKNYIGGNTETDAHHFFPVLINEKVATINLHSNRLGYNKTYYVQIDSEAFPFKDGGFSGITGKTDWTFSTKAAPPSADSVRLVVSADGTGDYNSVQGAIDSVPDNNPNPKTIFVKNGIYEEMISFRNKANFTLLGEDRDKVVIRYANNGVFNAKGRGVFTVQKSTDINLINFTIISVGEMPAQAEGLYAKGDKYQVHNVTIVGSGDAFQAGGTIYLSESSILGWGDNVLTTAALFFNKCELGTTYGPHFYQRNPQTTHGSVLLNSRLYSAGDGYNGDFKDTIARCSDDAGTQTWPYAEVVLINCALEGGKPEGWGSAAPDPKNVHFWEYNSVDSNGQPVDVSKRVSYSRQLTMETDSEIIANYGDPTYVLGGWTPQLAPIILTQLPETIIVPVGGNTELTISVAAVPAASYQWFKDSQLLAGKTDSILRLNAVSTTDSGEYSISIENSVGKVTSKANVMVGDAGTQTGTAGAGAQNGVGGAGAKTGAAGAGTQTGAAGVGTSTSPMSAAGTAVSSAGAPGSVAGSAGTSAAGDAALSSGDGCGCHIGPERGTSSGAWVALLAAFWITVRTRRRRRSNH
jgi:pectinesterase